ncbi:MAG: DUF2141 domain-containing protein [Candidatus Sphingomonas colombiensis]|nr:DUF2141 domain-containing protein [Sphingomonas sp.]WEK43674.1 MAG: DUF2141 domain-containing protein [Sphingomonas sp.]
MAYRSMTVLGAMLLLAAPAAAETPSILGPDAAHCAPGGGPAILVNITGLKNHLGTVRVRTFGGDTSTWFDKVKWQTKVEIPTPRTEPIRVCMPVAAPGTYAIDVRHDANANNQTDRSDGGGASGNPRVTVWDFIFGRKPSPKQTAVKVGQGVTEISVTMMYLSGTALKPLRETKR